MVDACAIILARRDHVLYSSKRSGSPPHPVSRGGRVCLISSNFGIFCTKRQRFPEYSWAFLRPRSQFRGVRQLPTVRGTAPARDPSRQRRNEHPAAAPATQRSQRPVKRPSCKNLTVAAQVFRVFARYLCMQGPHSKAFTSSQR